MIIKIYEKFAEIQVIKEVIVEKAIESGEEDMVKFFIKKGYNVNFDTAINKADNIDILKCLLENGADFKKIYDYKLKQLDIQKLLIDFGEEDYIYNNVGFHKNLKYDEPKYADVVARYEQSSKFNL